MSQASADGALKAGASGATVSRSRCRSGDSRPSLPAQSMARTVQTMSPSVAVVDQVSSFSVGPTSSSTAFMVTA